MSGKSRHYKDAIGNDDDAIALGLVPYVRHFTKFAYHPSLTAASGEQTIWAYTSGNFSPILSASTYTITYTNSTDGEGTNGALTLFFDHIDENGKKELIVHTLGSSGTDVTSFSGLGINRLSVSSSGSTDTSGSAITVTATSDGSVQAFIPAAASVTQQAIYHTPLDSRSVVRSLWLNCMKLSGSSPKVEVRGIVHNRGVDTLYEVFRSDIGTSVQCTVQIEEMVGFPFSRGDIFYIVADTNINATVFNAIFSLREYQVDR